MCSFLWCKPKEGFVLFGYCLLDACYFLKGNGAENDGGQSGEGGEPWGVKGEKMLGYILQEKNPFLVKNVDQKKEIP